jgi:hypothetical protein
LGLVEQAGEFVHPLLQLGDASPDGLASVAVRLGHAANIGTRAACRCTSWHWQLQGGRQRRAMVRHYYHLHDDEAQRLMKRLKFMGDAGGAAAVG